MNRTIAVNKRKCSVCGDCLAVCPQNILEIRKVGWTAKEAMTFFQRIDAHYHHNTELAVIDPEKCLGCGLCVNACRKCAISLAPPARSEIRSGGTTPRMPEGSITLCPDISGHSGQTVRKNITNFPPFYFFTILLLNLACVFFLPRFNRIHMPLSLIGFPFLAGGLYLINKSSDLFHKNKTTFYLEKPSAFVQNGFYRKSRNPMYLGMLFFIFGLAVLLGNLAGLAAPLIFFLTINCLCIPPEETLMAKTFGTAYVDYKKRVRRWI